jgi:hypothetical protein
LVTKKKFIFNLDLFFNPSFFLVAQCVGNGVQHFKFSRVNIKMTITRYLAEFRQHQTLQWLLLDINEFRQHQTLQWLLDIKLVSATLDFRK